MWMNVSTLPASMREHVIIMKDHISVIARTDGKDKTVKKVRMPKKISNLFSKELYRCAPLIVYTGSVNLTFEYFNLFRRQ